MKLIVDDTGDQPRLTIRKGSKILLQKRGKTMKQLLKFVYENTEKTNIKEAILELQHMWLFMADSKTTMEIR